MSSVEDQVRGIAGASSLYGIRVPIIEPFRAWKPLCHKEPARSKRNTPNGGILSSKAPSGGFGCDKLVLYGIRELRSEWTFVKRAYARNGLLLKERSARNGLLLKERSARTVKERSEDYMLFRPCHNCNFN